LTNGLNQGILSRSSIRNLHVDAHDFDSHTNDLEEIYLEVFSAHFGQLDVIFIWLSGMYFHGACFSNYKPSDPTHTKPCAQVVWPIVGQEILLNFLIEFFYKG
jgi:photosystem I P700 chlorophyll a apoprotein A1